MVQLLLNSFKTKPHPQKDMKRKLMEDNCNLRETLFTEYDKIVLKAIPDVVHNYMKEYNTKDGAMGLDCMLYIYVKEVVSKYTTYFLCAEDYIDSNNVKSESSYDIIIGVMVIEKCG